MSSRKCVVGSLVAVVILVAAGVGIYFAVAGGKSESNGNYTENPENYEPIVPDPPVALLFASTIDGRILQLDPNFGNYTTLVEEETYPIKSLEFYRKKQILFYGTAEPYEPIKVVSNGRKLSMHYSGPWTKTAMAIDYVTEQLFVLDGSAAKIYVIDTKNDRYSVYLEKLDQPMDILVDAEKRLVFVLQEASILWVEIDTRKIIPGVLVTHNVAFAIDRKREEIYFAESELLYSENYSRNRGIIYGKKYILCMTVFDSHLFFISKPGNGTDKSLNKCSLVDGRINCLVEDGETAVMIGDEKVSLLSNIKAYDFIKDDVHKIN